MCEIRQFPSRQRSIRLIPGLFLCLWVSEGGATACAPDLGLEPSAWLEPFLNTQPDRQVLFESSGTTPLTYETIVTDRPDFTEASSTVGAGTLQIENGYTYAYDHDGTDQTISHSGPESLFRLGIGADWLELRLATNLAEERVNGAADVGFEDLYLGAKLGLTLQDGLIPEMSLVPQMTVPTGCSVLTTNEVLPGMNWLYGWDVTECLTAAGSTQFNRAVDAGSGQLYIEWAQSWTFGYSLADRLGAYTEWFAFLPNDADTAVTEHYANGGITFLITDDILWDIRAGRGLNDAATDYFIGTGLSLRFR